MYDCLGMIVSEADLIIAAQKQKIYLESQVGTNPGTMVNIKNKKDLTRNG
jgi:hypothetical protein